MKDHVGISGTGVALVTPFTADSTAIDYEALERLLDYVGPHVDYLVVNGTTAEAPTVAHPDKKKVLEFIKTHNRHHKPIIMGVGGNSTLELLEFERAHNLNGVEAILSVSPYYNRPNQEGLYQHFHYLAENFRRPIILYNVPGRTGCKMSAETTLRLATHPNIIATKEASGDFAQFMHIAREKPEDFMLISGDDIFAVPMASFGAQGVISVIANALPEAYSQSVRAAINGDMATAGKLLLELFPINQAVFDEGNPTGVKQLLQLLGICHASVRLPLVPASEALAKKLKALLAELEAKQLAAKPSFIE